MEEVSNFIACTLIYLSVYVEIVTQLYRKKIDLYQKVSGNLNILSITLRREMC